MSLYSVGQTGKFSKTITEYDVYGFAGISGDFNTIHIDKVEAEKSLFGERVAHGILCSSLISTVLGNIMPGKGTIYMGQTLKFCAPVFIGDTITAEVTIKEILSNNKAVLDTIVRNQDNIIVIEGEATVKLPVDKM